MKVSTVMKAIPPYTGQHWLEELRELTEIACKTDSSPYTSKKPYPYDTEAIRNFHSNDINTQKINMKAAVIGVNRLVWLFGADAEFLGLRLAYNVPDQNDEFSRYNPDPVLFFTRIADREPNHIDAQYVYFLGQFNEASIFNLYSQAKSETGAENTPERRRVLLARKIFSAIQNYDLVSETQQKYAKAVKENSDKNLPGFARAKSSYDKFTSRLTHTEKVLFNTIKNHRISQITGIPHQKRNVSKNTQAINRASMSLPGDIQSFSKIALDAQLFAEQLAVSERSLSKFSNSSFSHRVQKEKVSNMSVSQGETDE
jgi:hypothetical protein